MFKRLVILMIVLTLSVSVVTTAEESQMKANIVAEAIADAVRDVNRMSESVVGYFFNRIGGDSRGTRIAPILTGRLLGKPPAYVTAYTVNYQAQQTRTHPVETVLLGLILIGVGTFCLWQINNEVNEASDDCLNSSCSLPEPGGCNYFGYGF